MRANLTICSPFLEVEVLSEGSSLINALTSGERVPLHPFCGYHGDQYLFPELVTQMDLWRGKTLKAVKVPLWNQSP